MVILTLDHICSDGKLRNLLSKLEKTQLIFLMQTPKKLSLLLGQLKVTTQQLRVQQISIKPLKKITLLQLRQNTNVFWIALDTWRLKALKSLIFLYKKMDQLILMSFKMPLKKRPLESQCISLIMKSLLFKDSKKQARFVKIMIYFFILIVLRLLEKFPSMFKILTFTWYQYLATKYMVQKEWELYMYEEKVQE